jgi:hypothetical protein
MATTTTPNDTYDGTACIDCVMLIANGEAPALATETEESAWLADWNSRNDGILWVLNDDYSDFSSTPCTCCGSTLGGSRHDVIGWNL